jgi:Cu2+-exporting ATPase
MSDIISNLGVSSERPLATPAAKPLQTDFSLFVRHEGGLASMDLAVDGIQCAACMGAIERGLKDEPGLVNARVNLANKRVTVSWSDGRENPGRVIERLDELGFKAYPFSAAKVESAEAREERRLLRCLGVAGFAMMNIMLFSVSVWSGHDTNMPHEMRDLFHWISALIALPTAAYAGRPFFESAMRALRVRSVNMDVPITLGVVLALGMSVFETLNSGEHAYFDGVVMLLFFLLIGRYLDQAMRKRTRDTASNLAALRSETAVKFTDDHELLEVPIAAIAPGDLVLVKPGQRVSVDGVVEGGRSDIDQSLVTGETAHQAVDIGSAVYAGTLNMTGALRIRVSKANEGTLLDEVEKLLSRATESRSAYVQLADRAARLYAPVVHVIAAATFLGWMAAGLGWQPALVIAITVLIITCPCALGLAIPAVQVVAAGALFRKGVLLGSGDALERLAGADTLVFDKTGTLTLPQASIANLAAIAPEDLALAGRLALSSTHPLAAVIAKAAQASAPLAGVTEKPGYGLDALHDGVDLRLGSPFYCGVEDQVSALMERHPDASFIAFRQGARAVIFAVAQALRPDAAEIAQRLRGQGLSLAILSGDRSAPVAKTAAALGVTDHQGSLKPADKIARVEALRAEGRQVLMVGDGINDAPALAAANASMSPASAAHLTQTAADAVFLGDKLAPVADAIQIARKAKRIMVENLWLAVIYNMIAVPIAIAGHATPFVAALAMSGSSIIVTLNALRARR